MKQNIEKSDNVSYEISISLRDSMEGSERRQISHLEMCKYNGVRMMGKMLQLRFPCSCEDTHCSKPKEIFIQVEESATKETNEYSSNLHCTNDKDTMQTIMQSKDQTTSSPTTVYNIGGNVYHGGQHAGGNFTQEGPRASGNISIDQYAGGDISGSNQHNTNTNSNTNTNTNTNP